MDGFEILKMGPNKERKHQWNWQRSFREKSRLDGKEISLKDPDYDVDVLIIGGGGAGSSATIEADEAGAKVMIVTKLRLGDANTMMAEGGIQAADKENDSPAQHYLDVMGGGHFANVPELVHKLVTEGPAAVNWLDHMGVMFDKDEDGRMVTTHGGGTSRKRMHAAKDYSGADIMRTLRDEVLNRRIPVVDFTAAVELIKDTEGKGSRSSPYEHGDKGSLCCTCKNRHHCNRRCRTYALSGIPDFQPLWSNCRRIGSGLSCWCPSSVSGYAAVSSDRCCIPGSDFRGAGNGKSSFYGSTVCKQRRYCLWTSS